MHKIKTNNYQSVKSELSEISFRSDLIFELKHALFE